MAASQSATVVLNRSWRHEDSDLPETLQGALGGFTAPNETELVQKLEDLNRAIEGSQGADMVFEAVMQRRDLDPDALLGTISGLHQWAACTLTSHVLPQLLGAARPDSKLRNQLKPSAGKLSASN